MQRNCIEDGKQKWIHRRPSLSGRLRGLASLIIHNDGLMKTLGKASSEEGLKKEDLTEKASIEDGLNVEDRGVKNEFKEIRRSKETQD